jgi:hypothetical protein
MAALTLINGFLARKAMTESDPEFILPDLTFSPTLLLQSLSNTSSGHRLVHGCS